MIPRFGFNYKQSINPRMMLSKRRSVYVINLLALLGENKNNIDIMKSSICINFNQTMMEIYYDSFIGGIKPITFE
jgi:hypothetical protein